MGYLERCRVCDTTHNLQFISQEGNDTILSMLRIVTSSPIEFNGYLPQHICLQCSEDLKEAYTFRSLYFSTYAKMKKILLNPNKRQDGAIILRKLIKSKSKNSRKKAIGQENADLNDFNQELILPDYVTEMNDDLGDNETRDEDTKPSEPSKNSGGNNEQCNHMRTKESGLVCNQKNPPLRQHTHEDSEIFSHESTEEQSIEVTCFDFKKDVPETVDLRNDDITSLKSQDASSNGSLNKNTSETHSAGILNTKTAPHSSANKTCDECGKSFARSYNLKLHKATHSNKGMYKCKCGKAFKNAKGFRQHIDWHSDPALHSKSSINQCEECGKSFATSTILKLHVVSHTKTKVYKCICGDAFGNSKGLGSHLRWHSNPALHSDSNFNKCDKCGKSFGSLEDLAFHMDWHSNNELYKCKICGKTFQNSKNYKPHMLLHSNPDLYKCEKCGKSFKSAFRLKEHKTSHSNSYKCEECGKSFAGSQIFRNHMALHANPDLYQCEICGRSFSSACVLKQHKMSHTDRIKCKKCGKSFAGLKNFKAHQYLHSNHIILRCDLCAKTFARSDSFKQHMTWHSNPNTYKCNECDKSFKSSIGLAHHLFSHSDSNKCDECGKSFASQQYFKRHLALHQNPDLYKCGECGKAFTSSGPLKAHKASHYELLECDICDKTFSLIKNFKKHMTLHKPLDLYECNICQKSFNSSYGLTQHKVSHTDLHLTEHEAVHNGKKRTY